MYKRLKIAALGAVSCLLLFLLWIGICWKRPWSAIAPDSFPAWVPEDWGPNVSPKPKELLINGEKRLVYASEDEQRILLHAEQSVAGGKFVLDEAQINSQTGFLNLYGHAVGVADFLDNGFRPLLHEEKEGGVNGISWPCYYAPRKLGQPGDEVPFMVQFSHPPRFARKLYLRLFLDKAQLLGKTGEALPPFVDIAFDNPLRQIPRSRNAETLPASRNLDPLKLELLKVETEIPTGVHPGSMQPLSAHDGALPCATRTTFRLVDTRHDQPANAWRLMNGVFLSPPGFINDYNSSGIGDAKPSKEDPGIFVAETPATLWKSSGPWKLRLQFARHDDFRPDEILTISNAALPGEGKDSAPDERKWTVAGRDILFTGLAKEKADAWSNGQEVCRCAVHANKRHPRLLAEDSFRRR